MFLCVSLRVDRSLAHHCRDRFIYQPSKAMSLQKWSVPCTLFLNSATSPRWRNWRMPYHAFTIIAKYSSTLPCPYDSCRNDRNPQESSGMGQESTGIPRNGTGIHRNPQEWDWNPQEQGGYGLNVYSCGKGVDNLI